jgi:hypothetical protein
LEKSLILQSPNRYTSRRKRTSVYSNFKLTESKNLKSDNKQLLIDRRIINRFGNDKMLQISNLNSSTN